MVRGLRPDRLSEEERRSNAWPLWPLRGGATFRTSGAVFPDCQAQSSPSTLRALVSNAYLLRTDQITARQKPKGQVMAIDRSSLLPGW